ncbi:hypothetical protein AGMMS50249_2490 [candidate division SR1 bacterium]|nr:hypothetical protein AGMMS50249_2490 [candidate division SR1 bacterium]
MGIQKLKDHYQISKEIFEASQKSPEMQKISEALFADILHTLQHPREKKLNNPANKAKLTGQDLFSILGPVEDVDFSYLTGLLGQNPEYFQETAQGKKEIVDKGFLALEHIFNMGAKHSIRHGLNISFFSTFLKNFCEVKNGKVYFRLKTPKQYQELVKHLTTTNNPDKELFIQHAHQGLFLKNLIRFSDLNKNEVFRERRRLFSHIVSSVFEKYFNEKIPLLMAKEGNFEINTTFVKQIEDKNININISGNHKTEKSLMDKMGRDPSYSASQSINDIIRFQIVMPDYEVLILQLADFISYYLENPEEEFQIDPKLNLLKIKDKGIINSKEFDTDLVQQSIKKIENADIKEFISQCLTHENPKSKNKYRDVKLIVPMKSKGKGFNMEVKFVLSDWENTNESGFDSHEIHRLIQNLELQSRNQKFVRKSEIYQACVDCVNNNPKLHEEISAGENWKTIDKLFRYVLKGFKSLKKLNSKDEVMVFEKQYKRMTERNYYPDISF